jgi:hypothetical protein
VRSGRTEALVAMHVACEPLDETPDGADPVAASLEHLHAGVEALHKPAGLPPQAVGRDLPPPPLARPQQARELGPPALTPPLAPSP